MHENEFGFSSGLGPHNRRYLKAVDTARIRTVVLLIFLLFLWGSVFVKLMMLGFGGAEEGEGKDRYLEDHQFKTARSRILDRNGVLLASSVKTGSLYCNPRKISDPSKLAQQLHKIFPATPQKTFASLLSVDRKFVWLARAITPLQRKELLYLGNPELKFIDDEKRIYPQGKLFAHVIGLVSQDNEGLSGLEKSFDQSLRRNEGDLVTSLDIKLQHAVRSELLYGMKEFEATGATAIVLDVKTSEVLALVSLPDYDPNNIPGVNHPSMFNRAVSGIYEMGSTMKVINTAMGLSQKGISLHKTYNTSEALKVGRFTITDYRAEHGHINVGQIFVHSSNKGSARIALEVGGERQQAFFKEIGLFDRAEFELPEYSRPMYPKRWREATTITASYGYGIAISPLQLLNASASVLIDGCRKNATLLKQEMPAKDQPQLEICHRVVSEKVARTLRQLFYFTAVSGTSKRAFVPGFYVGAKTGTRDMLIDGRYDKNRVATSFVGLIGESVGDPRYLVVVMLEDPKRLKKTFGFNAAGWNAAPIGGRIMNRVAVLQGLHPMRGDMTADFDKEILKMDFEKKK